jgi:formylglycine-generating enzyme required for sulfatase activity
MRFVFRLATPQEFAYVFNGTSSAPEDAWTKSNSPSGMHAVGTRKANRFSLFDILGNCWEWMADSKFYGMSTSDVPTPEFTSIAASGANIQGNPEDYSAGNVSFRVAADTR